MESPAADPAIQSLDHWWTSFADPQLDALIETALHASTDARQAYFRVIEARATLQQSLRSTLPTGNLSASAGTQNTFNLGAPSLTTVTGASQSYGATFSPSWEIDLLGRLGSIRQGARLSYEAARFDYHDSRMVLAADVATALFQARATAVQLEQARDTLRISQDLAATSHLGESHGLIAGADTARLDSDVANARAEVTRLEALLRTSRRSLLVLIGRPSDATDSLDIQPKLAAPPAVPHTTPGDLLTRRPDVRAAQARLLAAARNVQVNRLALYPKLTLSGSLGINRATGMLGADTAMWSIAAGAVMPILDRPRLLAALRISQAQGNEAVVTFETTVQTAFREADNALTNAAADRSRLIDLAQANERARFAFDAARNGYRLGLTDLTTLLQSERSWLAARSALTAAQAQSLADTVAAFRALGGGWQPDAATDISSSEPR